MLVIAIDPVFLFFTGVVCIFLFQIKNCLSNLNSAIEIIKKIQLKQRVKTRLFLYVYFPFNMDI
jgi:hypothetical protein